MWAFCVRMNSRNFEFIRKGYALLRENYAFILHNFFPPMKWAHWAFVKKKIPLAIKILKYFEPVHKTKAGRSMIV